MALDRLSTVLSTGIDVEPTSAPMFSTTSLGKAAEYGGMPIVILVLDESRLGQSFRVLAAGRSADEVVAALKTYPNVMHQEDGTIWCSRFSLDDLRMGTGYEVAYGRWAPGDAHAALRSVLIVAEETHCDDVIDRVVRSEAISSTRSPSTTAPTVDRSCGVAQ